MSDDIQVKRVLWLYLPKSTAKRVVLLTGARQTGKTTLSKSAYPDLRYINLDAPENRDALKAISTSTWGRDVGNAVIDEAQKAPVVFEIAEPSILGRSLLPALHRLTRIFHESRWLKPQRSGCGQIGSSEG